MYACDCVRICKELPRLVSRTVVWLRPVHWLVDTLISHVRMSALLSYRLARCVEFVH